MEPARDDGQNGTRTGRKERNQFHFLQDCFPRIVFLIVFIDPLVRCNSHQVPESHRQRHLQEIDGKVVEIIRRNDGDVFHATGVQRCDEDVCIGLSSGTASLVRDDTDEINSNDQEKGATEVEQSNKKQPSGSCTCRCHRHLPAYREDLSICVDDVRECSQLAPFVSGTAHQSIPFVFLPLKGQIVHPSKEIRVTGVERPVCAISNGRFLTGNGWIDLRDPIDSDVPFRLYRDEGRTFLQWIGEQDLRKKMTGRLILIELLCKETERRPTMTMTMMARERQRRDENGEESKSISEDTGDPVKVIEPCVAFRVVGTPTKYNHDVTEVQFSSSSSSSHSSSSSSPSSTSFVKSDAGLTAIERITIGVASVLLGLIYVASIMFYLHLRKRKKDDEAASNRRRIVDEEAVDLERSQTKETTSKNKEFDFVDDIDGDLTVKEEQKDAVMKKVANNRHQQVHHQHRHVKNGVDPESSSCSCSDNERPAKKIIVSSVENEMAKSMYEDEGSDGRWMARRRKRIEVQQHHLTSALVHPIKYDRFLVGDICNGGSGIERLPEENVSIVETIGDDFGKLNGIASSISSATSDSTISSVSSSAAITSNGRKKLYFNPAYFEPHLLISPPPAAIEFLTKIREVISIAKQKMASKRFVPNLTEIPEEDDEQLDEDEAFKTLANRCHPQGELEHQRHQRLSRCDGIDCRLTSLKRENSRKLARRISMDEERIDNDGQREQEFEDINLTQRKRQNAKEEDETESKCHLHTLNNTINVKQKSIERWLKNLPPSTTPTSDSCRAEKHKKKVAPRMRKDENNKEEKQRQIEGGECEKIHLSHNEIDEKTNQQDTDDDECSSESSVSARQKGRQTDAEYLVKRELTGEGNFGDVHTNSPLSDDHNRSSFASLEDFNVSSTPSTTRWSSLRHHYATRSLTNFNQQPSSPSRHAKCNSTSSTSIRSASMRCHRQIHHQQLQLHQQRKKKPRAPQPPKQQQKQLEDHTPEVARSKNRLPVNLRNLSLPPTPSDEPSNEGPMMNAGILSNSPSSSHERQQTIAKTFLDHYYDTIPERSTVLSSPCTRTGHRIHSQTVSDQQQPDMLNDLDGPETMAKKRRMRAVIDEFRTKRRDDPKKCGQYESDSLERNQKTNVKHCDDYYIDLTATSESPPSEEETLLSRRINSNYRQEEVPRAAVQERLTEGAVEEVDYDEVVVPSETRRNNCNLVSEVYVNNGYNYNSDEEDDDYADEDKEIAVRVSTNDARKTTSSATESDESIEAGRLLIEVADCLDHYIRIDSDQFEPDTLDRKANRDEDNKLEVKLTHEGLIPTDCYNDGNSKCQNALISSNQNEDEESIDECYCCDSLERPKADQEANHDRHRQRPDVDGRERDGLHRQRSMVIALRTTGSFNVDEDVKESRRSNRANNEFVRTFGSLREIYENNKRKKLLIKSEEAAEEVDQKQEIVMMLMARGGNKTNLTNNLRQSNGLQAPPNVEVDAEEAITSEGRLLTLEERHARRQRKESHQPLLPSQRPLPPPPRQSPFDRRAPSPPPPPDVVPPFRPTTLPPDYYYENVALSQRLRQETDDVRRLDDELFNYRSHRRQHLDADEELKNVINDGETVMDRSPIGRKAIFGDLSCPLKLESVGSLRNNNQGSETDESLGDGQSESGAESVETHSVFFGSYRDASTKTNGQQHNE